MVRIAVLGATGRMGSAIVRLLAESVDLRLSGAATEPGHPLVGADAAQAAGCSPAGVLLADAAAAAVAGCDVAIDFTVARATPAHLAACRAAGCALVLGTTGLSDEQFATLRAATSDIPVVYGRNMSVGVLVLTELARQAARLLGPEADVEIVEAHHSNKIDAPSGTALQVGEAVAAERGADHAAVAVFDRSARREARRSGTIGYSSIRAGNIVGDHDVHFALAEEVVTLRHRALDRATFARGALRAARWVAGRPGGLYTMEDVLGLARKPG